MVAGWPGAVVVTVFVITTVLCAVSLSVRSPARGPRLAAAEANHVVMSVAMILMVEPATMAVVPPAVGAWLFGAAGAGWLALLVRLRWREEPLGPAVGFDRCTAHPTHLLLVDAAMAAMYVAMIPSGGDDAMADMPGMDMGGSGPSPALVVVLGGLALYLAAHAVATVVVIARCRRRPTTTGECATTAATDGCTTTAASGEGATTAAPTRGALATLARPVAGLAHGVPQLVGQAGMSAAMAAMLLLTL